MSACVTGATCPCGPSREASRAAGDLQGVREASASCHRLRAARSGHGAGTRSDAESRPDASLAASRTASSAEHGQGDAEASRGSLTAGGARRAGTSESLWSAQRRHQLVGLARDQQRILEHRLHEREAVGPLRHVLAEGEVLARHVAGVERTVERGQLGLGVGRAVGGGCAPRAPGPSGGGSAEIGKAVSGRAESAHAAASVKSGRMAGPPGGSRAYDGRRGGRQARTRGRRLRPRGASPMLGPSVPGRVFACRASPSSSLWCSASRPRPPSPQTLRRCLRRPQDRCRRPSPKRCPPRPRRPTSTSRAATLRPRAFRWPRSRPPTSRPVPRRSSRR